MNETKSVIRETLHPIFALQGETLALPRIFMCRSMDLRTGLFDQTNTISSTASFSNSSPKRQPVRRVLNLPLPISSVQLNDYLPNDNPPLPPYNTSTPHHDHRHPNPPNNPLLPHLHNKPRLLHPLPHLPSSHDPPPPRHPHPSLARLKPTAIRLHSASLHLALLNPRNINSAGRPV